MTPLFGDKVLAMPASEEIVERIEPDTDLIGISCMFSQDWPEIRRLIQMVRRRFPRIPIVAGETHHGCAGVYSGFHARGRHLRDR